MKELNENLFTKGIWCIVNDDEIVNYVLADNKEEVVSEFDLTRTAPNADVVNYWDKNDDPTLKDLKEMLDNMLPKAHLKDILKSVRTLFYECFDKKEYTLVLVHNTDHHYEYAIVDNIWGVGMTFTISVNYNVYETNSKGTLLSYPRVVKQWLSFLEKADQVQKMIYQYDNLNDKDEDDED